MREQTTGDLLWYQFDQLAELGATLTHGIFTRHGGVSVAPYTGLNAGLSVGDDPQAVATNRSRIVAALPGSPLLITARPIHGSEIVEVNAASGEDDGTGTRYVATKADAMLTRTRGLGLFWAYADCTPIMLVDRAHDAIALVHAGWRGTAQAVVIATLQAMTASYGTRVGDVLVGMGPTIGPCCYEVDEPVQQAFATNPLARDSAVFSTVQVEDDHHAPRPSLRLDVMASNERQLIAAGVPPRQIETFDLCTGHHLDQFYSFRQERRQTGRHAVVIGLR